MNTLVNVLRELLALFVDDGSLALHISFVAALAAIIVTLAPDVPILAGIALLAGCLSALLNSVTGAGTR